MKDSKPYKMILQINWMLWGVLLCSQVFFVVMAIPVMHFDQMIQTVPQQKNGNIIPLFLSLALILGALSFYFHRRAYQFKRQSTLSPQDLVDGFKRFQMSNMFSWAISESMTLLGIVSVLFQAPNWILFALCLSGFSLHAFYYPRVGKFFERFATFSN